MQYLVEGLTALAPFGAELANKQVYCGIMDKSLHGLGIYGDHSYLLTVIGIIIIQRPIPLGQPQSENVDIGRSPTGEEIGYASVFVHFFAYHLPEPRDFAPGIFFTIFEHDTTFLRIFFRQRHVTTSNSI
jgi:hypothetical protein